MKKGASDFITEDDLFPLVPSDESFNLGNDLKQAMEKQYVTPFISHRIYSVFAARSGRLYSLPMEVHMRSLPC